MPERDPSEQGGSSNEADQTLLGVAPPPPLAPLQDSRPPSPVSVRSGPSLDADPAPLPSIAFPIRARHTVAPGFVSSPGETPGMSLLRVPLDSARSYFGAHPLLGMFVLPLLSSVCLIALTRHAARHERPAATDESATLASASAPAFVAKAPTLAELEARPEGSLSSHELVLRAQAHAEQDHAAANALRERLERDPALGKDNAVQTRLLELVADPGTAWETLSAMAGLEPPSGPDLLYEVWIGKSVAAGTAELAREILYSTDMRPKASPALSVALDLRIAETCQQYQAILPKALTDGDRRAVHSLIKLSSRRGCGPKKSADCFSCLRDKADELTTAINAVKSRRAPSLATR